MTARMSPQATAEPKDSRPRRAPADAPGPDALALLQGLERLRDGLLRRLEQIEAMAQEQAERLDEDVSEREQTLSARVSVLETAQTRLQAEAKRREQEYQAALQQLDADRRLLADAWERLEQEQLETPAGPAPDAPPAPPAERPAAPRPAADPADEAVTRSILQQFQSLQGDVRRNARERKGR